MVSLFGLLGDALLPGEGRTLTAPALDPAHLAALRAKVGERVVFVTITAAVELPTLVAGRHGTVADVLAIDGDAVSVQAHGRVRVRSATRPEPPYQAEVTDEPDAGPPADLLPAVADLAAALASGVAEGGAERVLDAAAALIRAAAPADDLVRVTRPPLVDALRLVAAEVRGRTPAFAAERKLEAGLRSLAPKDALSPAQKRRLYSEVVEIEKALDVADPGTGSDGDDLAQLERRLRQAGLPPDAREVAKRQLRALRTMETRHHDFPTYRALLELMARLPWHSPELPPIDLDRVQQALDRSHDGLDRVKKRVLESLAVRALGGTSRATILCLTGPPGTGKTTIARAIAEALGRPFVSVALGGVHDESELRGHRPTFTAAAPGRILDAMSRAKHRNALMLLDEIDKLGADKSRSPMGALLEILDPEQNTAFRDNFLGVGFDLSGVFFICTANDASAIHPVLLDRLEQVELDGYAVDEKVRLARAHLLPRLATETGLGAPLDLADDVLTAVVEGHTREAGIRQLRRALEGLYRARALAKVRGQEDAGPVTTDEVTRVLGRARSPRREREVELPPGTAHGLSVNADGGALLPIEVVRLPGKGDLHLTGRLGEVLRESARAALSHLRHRPERYGLLATQFDVDLHVHLPDGATPKEGPSAGVALAIAMCSALSGRPVRADIAFTGELTLGGRVFGVGGVRAKALAAERAGCTQVVLPAENRGDLPEGLRVTPVIVETLEQAMAVAFS